MEAGQKTVIHKTRHAGLNYGCIAPGAWTLFDAETGAQLQPIYVSAGELLADLDAQHQSRFANRKPALQPAPDAVEAALDKLEKILSDLGLPATEQEAVPAARAARKAEQDRAEAQGLALEAADGLAAVVSNGHRCGSSHPGCPLCNAHDAYRAARAKVQP